VSTRPNPRTTSPARDAKRAQARAAYANRDPAKVAERKAYLAAWYLEKRRGGVPRVVPEPQTREQRLARRAAAERRRNAALTPEQRRAKRARWRPEKPRVKAEPVPKFKHNRLPRAAEPTPPIQFRRAPLLPCVVEVAPAPETVEQWMARTGRKPEALPGFQETPPALMPVRQVWRGGGR
jgi:hypothetical protein